MLNIVFLGTPKFAVPSLRKLAKNKNFNVQAVFCEPDRPIGRKQELKEPPIKKEAKKLRLNIFQPEKLKSENIKLSTKTHGRTKKLTDAIDAIDAIEDLETDVGVVVAYGQIIPKKILDIPKFGFLNIHPSLLPKYRGPSPIQNAILNGDDETGVSIMLLDEKMDHGPILAQKKIKIKTHMRAHMRPHMRADTAESLHDRLSELAADLIVKTANDWVAGKIKPKPQNHKKATFTKLLKREDGRIDWEKSAEEIERMVRAYYPWPGTFTEIKCGGCLKSAARGSLKASATTSTTKRLKIISAYIIKEGRNKKFGEFFEINKKLAVKCKKDALVLERVQLEGKKEMNGEEFLRGYLK